MKIKLSDNIRAFRKSHSLTQQQLADAMDVTVGAVYKWEAALSAPDLGLLVELAHFFDTSVDVLLGYEIKDNKHDAVVLRLKEHARGRDKLGLSEAEKALVRYPNSFHIVYQSAMLYQVFGITDRNKSYLRRSVELFERAILLINQNTDPKISEISIYKDMTYAYYGIGEAEKAVELLKANNPCGINDGEIGQALASACDLPEEAVPYLSSAFLGNIASFVRIVTGYFNVYFKRGEFQSAADILRTALVFFEGLRTPGKTGFLDRMIAVYYVCLASVQVEMGEIDMARESLRIAKISADRFDGEPNYKGNSIRFITGVETTIFDDYGSTANEAVITLIGDIGNDMLTSLWKETAA